MKITLAAAFGAALAETVASNAFTYIKQSDFTEAIETPSSRIQRMDKVGAMKTLIVQQALAEKQIEINHDEPETLGFSQAIEKIRPETLRLRQELFDVTKPEGRALLDKYLVQYQKMNKTGDDVVRVARVDAKASGFGATENALAGAASVRVPESGR